MTSLPCDRAKGQDLEEMGLNQQIQMLQILTKVSLLMEKCVREAMVTLLCRRLNTCPHQQVL